MSGPSSRNRPRLWLRFTLRQLFGFVALVAVAVPALMHASLWWAAAWLSGCLLVLNISLLGIVYREGHRRAFWIGFALFGSAYMVAVYGPWLDRHIGVRLVTTKVLAYAQLQGDLGPPPTGTTPISRPFTWESKEHCRMCMDMDRPIPRRSPFRLDDIVPPQWDLFQQVGHSLFALLLACVGGLVSRWFYATRSRH